MTGIQKTVAATVASAVALGLLFGLLDAATGDKLIAAVPLVFAPLAVWGTVNRTPESIQKAVVATVASAVALGALFGFIDAETGKKLIAAVPIVFAPLLVFAVRNQPA